MLAFLWTVTGLFSAASIGGFLRLPKSKSIRTDVVTLLIQLGIAGWAIYFIISGVR